MSWTRKVYLQSISVWSIIIYHMVWIPIWSEDGYEQDQWSCIFKKVLESNILVIGTPIWLSEKSSVATKHIERLYARSSQQRGKGQYIYFGKVGGCVITGNEDGIKHCSMSILYALQHNGYSIPPQADCGWIGEAGPGLAIWMRNRMLKTMPSPTEMRHLWPTIYFISPICWRATRAIRPMATRDQCGKMAHSGTLKPWISVRINKSMGS